MRIGAYSYLEEMRSLEIGKDTAKSARVDTNGVDNIKLLIVQEFKRIISNGNDIKVFKSVLIEGATRHIASHVVSMRESYIILNSAN